MDKATTAFGEKTVADVFGQIVWLMTQSKQHRQLFLSDLEWAIMPAILLKQFKIYYHQGQPRAVVFWATVSDEIAKRIAESDAPRLRANEWKSGNNPVVIEAVAPFGDSAKLRVAFEEELKNEFERAAHKR